MANLIIKPTSGGSLILQDEGGTAAHTIDASGNHTLSGTTNNIGTVTGGSIAGGSITNATTFPTGHILNIQQASRNATSTTTSQTPSQVPDLTVTMTNIKSTSSKFLIYASLQGGSNAGSNAGGAFFLYRGGSIVAGASGASAGSRTALASQAAVGSSAWVMRTSNFSYLDSPSSTSNQTYAIYWRAEDTTNGTYLNRSHDDSNTSDRSRGYSAIIVMEVA